MSSKLCVIDEQKPKIMYHFHTQESPSPSQSQEEAVPSSLTKCQVPPLRPPTKRARKNKNLDDATAVFLRHATTAISTAPDSQEAFGCMTANKLKVMEEEQLIMCEEIILKALNKGKKGQITPKTHLCEFDHSPPPPPPTTQPPHPPQQHGSVESDSLGSVWSGKKRRLLEDHSLGTYMSSAAVPDLSESRTVLCSLLNGLLRFSNFDSQIIDVCSGVQTLHQFQLFLHHCLPLDFDMTLCSLLNLNF
ncbi:hypothetical protein AB205_0113610 [Aquarana catesbeiana]|uniref:Uncharacterized protein n=1 Tax=Aquarana catesbeiana TaxID=8400 RepID=A0A2G9RF93_AQUCT|nr:hypothetical protein AB205_0113610 [Aquarana catesbeiana]